jgi:hypothetical protein
MGNTSGYPQSSATNVQGNSSSNSTVATNGCPVKHNKKESDSPSLSDNSSQCPVKNSTKYRNPNMYNVRSLN